MSTETPRKGHRYTRSAAAPSASPQNPHLHPQNPHHLNLEAHMRNSQSDMKSNQSIQPSQPTTPPRTPRRDNQSLPNSTAYENGSKQKSRNKNRPKNVMTSPVMARNGRTTPPLPSVGIPTPAKPINTPSTPAYAGPTFHASPAPSALPIPSFYSKSVPDSPGLKRPKSSKEVQPVKEHTLPSNSSISPPAELSTNTFHREESPLDFFFKADREEKARARSASSAQTAMSASSPFRPPIKSPRSSRTPPASADQIHTRRERTHRTSTSGIFSIELDGERDSTTPYGPAFSTPYPERINAVRSTNQPTQSVKHSSSTPQYSLDRSEALKAYLFSGHSLTSPAPTNSSAVPSLTLAPLSSSSYQHTSSSISGPKSTSLPSRVQTTSFAVGGNSKNSNNVGKASGRSSGLRQEVTPTKTPTRTPDFNSHYSDSPTPSSMYRDITDSNTNNFTRKYTPYPSSPPSPFGDASGSRNKDIQGMEDSLRRILKLDSIGNPGSNASSIGSVPAATVSVPNHISANPHQ